MIVFHGHDHFYARQSIDGVSYQLVPQPGCSGEGSVRQAAAYGHVGGETRSGSGFLKVTVSAREVVVDFLRCGGAGTTGAVSAHHYAVGRRAR